jgi:hypothetical protein
MAIQVWVQPLSMHHAPQPASPLEAQGHDMRGLRTVATLGDGVAVAFPGAAACVTTCAKRPGTARQPAPTTESRKE